jgi:hypothetical protein
MIIGTITVTIPKWIRAAAAVAVAAVVGLFLAFGSWALLDKYGIRSPGIWWAESLPPPSEPGIGAGLGEMLQTQLVVDWIFWFAVICGTYFLITRLGRMFAPR